MSLPSRTYIDPNFSNLYPASRRIRSNMEGYPGGSPYMTSSPLKENINKSYMQMTNGQVKITISTRTTDQRKINAGQLAFIDNKNFDKPRLLSLQSLNKLLVEEATGDYITTPRGKTVLKAGDMYYKHKILERFSLLGVVATNDTELEDRIPYERGPRTFTVVTWGSAFILNYWSSNAKNLNRYVDKCYLVLKRVKIDENYHTFQDDLTVQSHDVPSPFSKPINHKLYYWQVVPYHTRDNAIPPSAFTSTYSEKDENRRTVEKVAVGTYWRIGQTHEYADIGLPTLYGNRNEYSVSRDVTYLHNKGKARPMQFYLHLDDDTKLI